MPVISNVTARPHGGPDEIRERLVEQVVSPVRWEESIRYLLEQGFTAVYRIGAGDGVKRFFQTHR
jgi:[acyl-carrier-protein] S-malonyltransferase